VKFSLIRKKGFELKIIKFLLIKYKFLILVTTRSAKRITVSGFFTIGKSLILTVKVFQK